MTGDPGLTIALVGTLLFVLAAAAISVRHARSPEVRRREAVAALTRIHGRVNPEPPPARQILTTTRYGR